MNFLWIVRIVAFAVLVGLAAGSLSPYIRLVDLLSKFQSDEDQVHVDILSKHFDWLGILSGVLTVASLPAMVGLDFVRQGMITSIIAVEFLWMTVVLWGFWIATTVSTVKASHIVAPLCPFTAQTSGLEGFCDQIHTAEGLSIVMCIVIPLYPFALAIAMGLIKNKSMAASRMWMSTVREAF